jgi:hypothetical protein
LSCTESPEYIQLQNKLRELIEEPLDEEIVLTLNDTLGKLTEQGPKRGPMQWRNIVVSVALALKLSAGFDWHLTSNSADYRQAKASLLYGSVSALKEAHKRGPLRHLFP